MGMFGDNRYILYTKDVPVLSFVCERDADGNPVFVQKKRLDGPLPISFSDIHAWIENRRAPKHRTHIKELLERCGCNDLEGFVRFAYCAGLNDTFWVRPEDIEASWDDISLYRNEFDENIARLAFGTGLMGEEFTSTTPELATDGSFPKCWKRFQNDIFLLKQGSSGAVNAGREPFSEAYAYELSKQICDDPLPYNLIRFHKSIVSRCKLFTSEEVGYTPAVSFFGRGAALDGMIRFFDEIGSGDSFRQMIVLDALTLNTDRHLKNFGVLYDNDSMRVLRMAPVFDNNLSLCPFADMDDLYNMDAYMATRQCAIGDGFNESAQRCLTPDIRDRLHQVRQFRFSRERKLRLPEERLMQLEELVHKQAENLLHERVISAPSVPSQENVVLNGFFIIFSAKDVPDSLLDGMLDGSVRIGDFDICTAPGDILHISRCEYTANRYGDKIELDVYECDTDGETSSLEVRSIEGLVFEGCQSIPAASRIELQLDKGERSVTTCFEDFTFDISRTEELEDIFWDEEEEI